MHPDARLLAKHGQIVAGYNVQIAGDAEHKLIVASEVTNAGNDTGQFYEMAAAAKEALGPLAMTGELAAVADSGYYNGDTLKACEDNAITAYVAVPERGRQLRREDRFALADFVYDGEADLYRCPAGSELRPVAGPRRQQNGKMMRRYVSRRSVCRTCPLRQQCRWLKRDRREIERWIHHPVIERHRERMRRHGKSMRRRRRRCLEAKPTLHDRIPRAPPTNGAYEWGRRICWPG